MAVLVKRAVAEGGDAETVAQALEVGGLHEQAMAVVFELGDRL